MENKKHTSENLPEIVNEKLLEIQDNKGELTTRDIGGFLDFIDQNFSTGEEKVNLISKTILLYGSKDLRFKFLSLELNIGDKKSKIDFLFKDNQGKRFIPAGMIENDDLISGLKNIFSEGESKEDLIGRIEGTSNKEVLRDKIKGMIVIASAVLAIGGGIVYVLSDDGKDSSFDENNSKKENEVKISKNKIEGNFSNNTSDNIIILKKDDLKKEVFVESNNAKKDVKSIKNTVEQVIEKTKLENEDSFAKMIENLKEKDLNIDSDGSNDLENYNGDFNKIKKLLTNVYSKSNEKNVIRKIDEDSDEFKKTAKLIIEDFQGKIENFSLNGFTDIDSYIKYLKDKVKNRDTSRYGDYMNNIKYFYPAKTLNESYLKQYQHAVYMNKKHGKNVVPGMMGPLFIKEFTK